MPIGIALGGELSATGLPALWLPAYLVLYLLLLLTFDQLVLHFRLDAWGLFLVSMVYGVVIGGLVDREFVGEKDSVLTLFGLDVLAALVTVAYWGAFAVIWLHLLQKLAPRPSQVPHGWWRYGARAVLWLAFIVIVGGVASDKLGPSAPKPFGQGDVILLGLAAGGGLGWLVYALARRSKSGQVVAEVTHRWLLTLPVAFVVVQVLMAVLLPAEVRMWPTIFSYVIVTIVCVTVLSIHRRVWV